MWWQIFLFVCSSIVSALLAPKPTNAKASSLGDIQAPTAEEGRCITKILGTCKVSGPNCTWYGNLKTKAVKVSSSGFFGIGAQSQIIAWRYYLGMQLALTVGKIDALVDILVGEKSLGVSADFSEAGTLLHVDKEDLFGGDRQEGGIAGDLAFYFGSAAQQGDSYLAGVFKTPVPGYRGVCHAVLHRMYLGTSNYLKDWAFILRATPAPAGLPSIWANINGDTNPSYGIAEILTCDVEEGGMGVSASRLDLASYEAAAQTLYEEGFGISLQMDNEQAAEEYLADICRTINAVHYTDPSTGLWTLKLVRQDYDPATLPEYGPADLQQDPEITWPSWPETLNKVVIKYVNRADGFTTGTAQDRDSGNRAIQGVDIATTLEFAMISNETVAQMVAGRERRIGAYPLASLRLVFNRRAWALRPGSVFKFNYPPMSIQGLICRVANIRYGRLGDAKITVEAVEDIFAAVPATYTSAPSSSWTDPLTTPEPASQQTLIEAPYWLVGQSRNVIALGARGDETTESMDVWTNAGNGYLKTATLDSPTPTGVLSASWSALTAALDPTGFAVGSGVDLDHLASTNVDGLYRGVNLALVGATEWISWTTVTDLGGGSHQISGILRGLLDTVPIDHAAGERVWFIGDGMSLTLSSDTSSSSTVTSPSDVPGLDAALNTINSTLSAQESEIQGKASSSHTHTESEITSLVTDLAARLTDAPSNDSIYGRRNGTWSEITNTGGGGGVVVNLADLSPANPNAWDDEFNGSSLNSTWASTTWNSGSITVNQGKLVVRGSSTAASGGRISKAIGSSTYKLTTKVKLTAPGGLSYEHAGLAIGCDATYNRIWLIFQGRSGEFDINIQYFNADGSYNYESRFSYGHMDEVYMQIVNDGVYRYYQISPDGFNWLTIKSEAYNYWCTETYATLSGGSSTTSADPYMAVFEFFRKNWTPASSANLAVNSTSILALGADVPPALPNSWDDEFTGDTGPGGTGVWSWLDQGTATYGIANGALKVTAPPVSGAQLRGLEKTISDSTWTITAKVALQVVSLQNYLQVGIYARNATSGRILQLILLKNEYGLQLQFASMTGPTAYNGVYSTVTINQPVAYIRLRCDGTNVYADYSPTGEQFTQFSSVALSAWITSVDKVGMCSGTDNSTYYAEGVISWIRKNWNAASYAISTKDEFALAETLTSKTWLGKAIYRKIVNIGSLPNATTKTVPHGITATGFVGVYGVVPWSGGLVNLPLSTPTASECVGIWIDAGNVCIWSGSNRSSLSGYAVVEYTKD